MRGGLALLLAVVAALDLCDCSKCVSAERGPSEVINGVMLKCGLSTDAATDANAEQCQVDGQDTVLQAAANGAVDSLRFCFFECKVPAEGTLDNLGLECEDLTVPERETVQAASASGNAVDLAPLPEIPESIGKVMGPYFAAAGRAMTTMGLYSDQAQQLTAAAGTMRQQARTIANQANEYQAAGNSADAATLMGTANDLMGKADASAASAQGLQSVAASINKGLPLYENARAAAGARAAYWAHLPGMIPPPVPAR
jgi:hypothetical protein